MFVETYIGRRFLVGNVLNQFRHTDEQSLVLGNCSTDVTDVIFDFPVAALRVTNGGGATVFVDLGSRGKQGVGGQVPGGGRVEYSVQDLLSMSLSTTSTEAGGFNVELAIYGSSPIPKVGADVVSLSFIETADSTGYK